MWWNRKEEVEDNYKEEDNKDHDSSTYPSDHSHNNSNNNNNNNNNNWILQQQPRIPRLSSLPSRPKTPQQQHSSGSSGGGATLANSSSNSNNKSGTTFFGGVTTTASKLLSRNNSHHHHSNNNNSNSNTGGVSYLQETNPTNSFISTATTTSTTTSCVKPPAPAVAETFMGFEVYLDHHHPVTSPKAFQQQQNQATRTNTAAKVSTITTAPPTRTAAVSPSKKTTAVAVLAAPTKTTSTTVTTTTTTTITTPPRLGSTTATKLITMLATSTNFSPSTKNNNNNNTSSSAATTTIHIQEELAARQHINRAQYNVSQWPALGGPYYAAGAYNSSRSQSSTRGATAAPNRPLLLKSSRYHRVPFSAVIAAAGAGENTNNATTTTTTTTVGVANNESSVEDVLFLLRSHEVVDEMTSLKQEVSFLDAELEALNKDTVRLEESIQRHQQQLLQQQQEQQQLAAAAPPPPPPPTPVVPAASASSLNDGNNTTTTISVWDIHELLASRSISVAQRDVLQSRRGNQLTVYFHDKQATEALANKCGIKPVALAKYRDASAATTLELNHDTCRDGGAATHVQQLSLLCKEGGTELSFFMGRDQTKSVYWGHLPDRLFRRMQDSGMNPKQSAAELTYLATGPMDAYYAEFRSGEAWWGTPVVEDDAFSQICTEWNVYRVAFGPVLILDDGSSGDAATNPSPTAAAAAISATPTTASTTTAAASPPTQLQLPMVVSSWIILSRDGRAAWKNLPSRLDNLLQSRMSVPLSSSLSSNSNNQVSAAAGLAEVSLGCGDSYFCRFLDGTVDYCLPSTLAAICQQLENRGSTITSIALHPELSHDFVIRSTTCSSSRFTPSAS